MARPKLGSTSDRTMVRLDTNVHAWLSLLAEKYETSLSGAIAKLIEAHEPRIIELHDEIEAAKSRKFKEE